MFKLLRKIEEFEIKLTNKIGERNKCILIFLLVISCYLMGYLVGNFICNIKL